MSSSLATRWQALHDALSAQSVQLLAVSKYTDLASIEAVAALGQVDFAESRPQQLRDRAQAYPHLRWHMIGPLQKNKAKYVAQFASMWHSLVDLDTAINVHDALPAGKTLPVLIQVNVSNESQKQGVAENDVLPLYQQLRVQCPHFSVVGMMGMAAHVAGDGEVDAIRASFRRLRQLRDRLLQDDGEVGASFAELSMGMSGDWPIAVQEGATMVRLGSVLFYEMENV